MGLENLGEDAGGGIMAPCRVACPSFGDNMGGGGVGSPTDIIAGGWNIGGA